MISNENYLAGKLLIAMPSMADPRFHRAVIFICAHDAKGAMGLVINQKLAGLQFGDLLGQLKIPSNIKVDMTSATFPVMLGGPVEGARGFLLHTGDFKQTDTITINDDYAVTGTVDALKEVALGRGPEHMMFLLGYSGWGAGQLEQELQDNAWLVVDPDPAIMFEAGPEEKWERAVGKLGVNPAMLSGAAGRA